MPEDPTRDLGMQSRLRRWLKAQSKLRHWYSLVTMLLGLLVIVVFRHLAFADYPYVVYAVGAVLTLAVLSAFSDAYDSYFTYRWPRRTPPHVAADVTIDEGGMPGQLPVIAIVAFFAAVFLLLTVFQREAQDVVHRLLYGVLPWTHGWWFIAILILLNLPTVVRLWKRKGVKGTSAEGKTPSTHEAETPLNRRRPGS